jgi:rubredoxin
VFPARIGYGLEFVVHYTEQRSFSAAPFRAAVGAAPAERMTMKKWQCFFCGYIYDEAAGIPEEGIEAGTRWDDVPSDWCCPGCGAAKSDFAMMEVAA